LKVRFALVLLASLVGCSEKTPPPPPKPVVVEPPLTVASAEAGQKLHVAKACNLCHSIDGSKLVGPSFKGLWGRTAETTAGPVTVDLAYFTESIRNPNAKVSTGYPAAMPPQALSDVEVESLALCVQSLVDPPAQ
jgi:cytochrome c oxidase subunit 2